MLIAVFNFKNVDAIRKVPKIKDAVKLLENAPAKKNLMVQNVIDALRGFRMSFQIAKGVTNVVQKELKNVIRKEIVFAKTA